MKIINRFFAWWKETFQKQGVVGKAVLGCSSLFVICCLCSIPLGILNQKSPASSIKPTSTFSVSTSTSPVAQIEQPTETPLSTPAIDSHPTELIVDVSKLIGVTISEVEAILGKPISTESISPDVIDDIPNGGEIQTYQVGAYEIDVDFDSQLNSTGVQIMKGLEEENWALTDWQTLLPRVGLDVTIAPDDSNDKRFVWHNIDGYGILISNGTSWQVWTVRVFLCQYSSLFPCSP